MNRLHFNPSTGKTERIQNGIFIDRVDKPPIENLILTNFKFEIILPYYKRPKIVLNALDSIKKSNNTNWHLTFIDDSGDDNFRETLMNYGFDEEKVTYIPILMSDEKKIKMGGSVFGKYMNKTILKTDCDIIVPICDDDALLSDYLDNLNIFYSKYPNEVWGYSHVKLYNPNIEHYSESNKIAKEYNWNLNRVNLNLYTTPINPTYKIDFSQVTYRKKNMIDGEIKYSFPRTENLDADIFTKMFNKFGFCKFTGCYGQYKCWNEDQLSSRISSGVSFYFNSNKIKNSKNGKSKI